MKKYKCPECGSTKIESFDECATALTEVIAFRRNEETGNLDFEYGETRVMDPTLFESPLQCPECGREITMEELKVVGSYVATPPPMTREQVVASLHSAIMKEPISLSKSEIKLFEKTHYGDWSIAEDLAIITHSVLCEDEYKPENSFTSAVLSWAKENQPRLFTAICGFMKVEVAGNVSYLC